MENNLFNKLKFFAQYFEQDVLTLGSNDNYPVNYQWMQCVSTEPGYSYLKLRSLKSITDDEAIEVAKLQDWKDYSHPMDVEDRRGIRDAIKVAFKNQWVNYTTYQYLQSRGFALPFHDLSVETLVEYGWIKLTPNP